MSSLFFSGCLFFLYYLGEKYYKPVRVQYCIDRIVLNWIPWLTLLGLRMCSWSGARLYGGNLLSLPACLPVLLFSLQLTLVHGAAPLHFLGVVRKYKCKTTAQDIFLPLPFLPH